MADNFPRFIATNVGTSVQSASTSNSSPVRSDSEVSWWTEAETKLFNQWASTFEAYNDSFNNPYFDYFYTGQDVQITIDGLNDANDILPIYSFGYSIQQQKTPLYGFWEYTYSAMLRGTRIITGAFSIVSMYPHLLTSKIAKAANNRVNRANGALSQAAYMLRGLDTDESNINKYWNRQYDNNLDLGQQHLFSIHPPFNFVLKYGLQDTSVTNVSPTVRAQQIRDKFSNIDPMMSDYNERLIQNPTAELGAPILLENIELISKQVEIDSEGNPLLETYAFIARDERIVPVNDDGMIPLSANQAVY